MRIIFFLLFAVVAHGESNVVYKLRVVPRWDADGNRFWYRNDLPGGKAEYVLVDALKGTREVVAKPPPFKAKTLTPTQTPRASRRAASEETAITFTNRTNVAVEIFWLPSDGRRKRYTTLRPGGTWNVRTYVGHTWLVADAKGRTLAVFEGVAEPGEAVIVEPPPSPPKTPSPVRIKDNNVWLGETALTKEGGYGGTIYWSPDGKKFVVMRTEKGDERKLYLVESSPTDQLQPKLQSYSYLKPGDRIPISKPHLFNVATAKEIPIADTLFPNPWSVTDIRWSPDSSQFTFLYNQRGHQVLRVIAVDARTGAARAVVDEQSATFIDYAHKKSLHHHDATHELIWMSERDGWNHLYLYDANTGQVKNQITHGEWVVRGVERVDEAKRQIWFRAGGIRPGQDPYYIHYCRVNFDGSGLVVLTDGDGTHNARFSPNGQFFVDAWSRVDLPTITELRRSDTGARVCELERADWSALLKAGWQVPERFVAKGRDGVTDIYGVIYRPRNFDPRKRYPIIENIYAGPHGSFVAKEFAVVHGAQELAEYGFVVVRMDGMGTSNRSKKFHDVCWKNIGDAGLPDRILWIKAAAAKYPQLDATRVGIYGGSAGGQNTVRAMLMYPEFYRVGVADCGCHDNRMDKIWWNELWMGWPVGPHYAEQSNVTQAHRLQGKLLLTVGELDRNVDPSSTMQLANALIKANKDFELIVIPGGGHGAGESAYGKRRRADFFVRNLR
jgi:dipeptidyl aminopeptidase/acylaminoacyl peptidase